MAPVHLIAKYSWLSISTPFIQVAEFLRKRGHSVIVYTDQDQQLNHTELPGITYFYSPPLLTRLFPVYFLRSFFSPKERNSSLCICFDTASLIYSRLFLSFDRTIYISLELYEVHGRSILGRLMSHFVEFLESIAIHECDLILSQSETRNRRLHEKYRINSNKMYVLPNTNTGSVISGDSDYLRNKFSIPENKKIVLFMGSLMAETGLLELLEAISSVSEEFVFVFHGWFPNPSLKSEFLKVQEEHPARIFLSSDLLDQEGKYQLIKSADVGCAFFQPIHYNFALGLGSAGKVFDYARCGIPVIVNDSEEGHEIVVKNKIGAVTSFDNLTQALKLALMVRQEDCYAYFERNEFTNVFSHLYPEIIGDYS